jgi:hypothetical protein
MTAMGTSRHRLPVLLALLALAVTACGAQPGASPGIDGGTGTLVITALSEMPADEPISIGGYGYFATVDDGEEQEIPLDGELRIDLPAGTHHLLLTTRPANDAVVCEPGGECDREFFDVSAGCEDDLEVQPGAEVQVTYRAIGGSRCEVTVD